MYILRVQYPFLTNKDAAHQLKKYLDNRFPWLEWIVIAYNNKNKDEKDTKAAYYNLNISYSIGTGSRGMNILAIFV